MAMRACGSNDTVSGMVTAMNGQADSVLFVQAVCGAGRPPTPSVPYTVRGRYVYVCGCVCGCVDGCGCR
jgi:hypothetical protein